jgi:hypothetical protein
MSAFALSDDVLYHTYSTYARGIDALWGMYQWLDRAPKGVTKPGLGSGGGTSIHEILDRGCYILSTSLDISRSRL